MDNSILNQLLSNPVYLLMAAAGIFLFLFLLLIIALCKIRNLKKKYKLFMMGKDGSSLEEVLQRQLEEVLEAKEAIEESQKKLMGMESSLQNCYQKMGIVHYDALKNMAGKTSFVLVLLDDNNNGPMINSIHTREGNYIYTKLIVAGRCDTTLGKEETKALQQALNQEYTWEKRKENMPKRTEPVLSDEAGDVESEESME